MSREVSVLSLLQKVLRPTCFLPEMRAAVRWRLRDAISFKVDDAAVTLNVYTVNVTSTHGVYGTPEFVARQALGVRVAG